MAADAWLTLVYAARRERAWVRLLEEAGSAVRILSMPDGALAQAGLGPDAIARLRAPDTEALEAWRDWLSAPDHGLITLGSPAYPPRLAAIDEPPLALWAHGARPELLGAPQVAVVGSRNATRSGRATAEQFSRYMAERGLTITSGLAAGIDEAGHRGAVATVGGTVAVLGCGIDVVFPRSNARLALDIAARGVLVSEYPPGVPPNPWQFPARNRIIAGLSLGVLVVEAGGRSGALITAKAALESGREVFAIPGSIHNPLSRGCHRLIRQGAKLVEEAADVLVELQPLLELELEAPPGAVGPPGRADGDSSVPPGAAEGSPAGRDPAYARLLEALEYEPAGMAELASRSGLTTAELSSMLLILELEGFVEALPGGRYCRLPARSR